MNDFEREKINKVLNKLRLDDKKLVMEALIKITAMGNEKEILGYMSSLPTGVAETVVEIHAIKAQSMFQEEKEKELKEKTRPIREDAVQILLSLIESGSKDNDIRLVERATNMAIALHDKF
jgi:hypothetical protein